MLLLWNWKKLLLPSMKEKGLQSISGLQGVELASTGLNYHEWNWLWRPGVEHSTEQAWCAPQWGPRNYQRRLEILIWGLFNKMQKAWKKKITHPDSPYHSYNGLFKLLLKSTSHLRATLPHHIWGNTNTFNSKSLSPTFLPFVNLEGRACTFSQA